MPWSDSLTVQYTLLPVLQFLRLFHDIDEYQPLSFYIPQPPCPPIIITFRSFDETDVVGMFALNIFT